MTLQEGYNCFMEVPAFRISEPGIHQIKIRALDQEKSFTVTAVQSTTYGKDGATLKKALFPVDKDGFQDNNRSENTIVLTGRYLNTVSRLVRKDSDITEETPSAYVKLLIENYTQGDTVFQAVMSVNDIKTNAVIDALYSPEHDGGAQKNENGSISIVYPLSSQFSNKIVFPIYIDRDKIEDGTYYLNFHDGSENHRFTLTIIKDSADFLFSFLFLTAFFAGIVFLSRSRLRSCISLLSVKNIILIALLATIMFTCINIPNVFLNDLLKIFLGPFSILITGLFTNVLFYIFLVITYKFMPHQGVFGLLLFLRYILAGVVFGSFSITSFIHIFYQILFLEALLWFIRTKKLLPSDGSSGHRKELLLAAVLFAAADAASTYVDITCARLFYRLFYANWYICLLLLIHSGLYTFFGCLVGERLGNRLIQVKGD